MTTTHLESIGHVCATLQYPYGRIRRVVDKLGLKPAVTINGVDHFDAKQVEQIANELARDKAPTTRGKE
jgi:hypothetical protein